MQNLPGRAAVRRAVQAAEQLQGVCSVGRIVGGLVAAGLRLLGHPPHRGTGQDSAVCSWQQRGVSAERVRGHPPQTDGTTRTQPGQGRRSTQPGAGARGDPQSASRKAQLPLNRFFLV